MRTLCLMDAERQDTSTTLIMRENGAMESFMEKENLHGLMDPLSKETMSMAKNMGLEPLFSHPKKSTKEDGKMGNSQEKELYLMSKAMF